MSRGERRYEVEDDGAIYRCHHGDRHLCKVSDQFAGIIHARARLVKLQIKIARSKRTGKETQP